MGNFASVISGRARLWEVKQRGKGTYVDEDEGKIISD